MNKGLKLKQARMDAAAKRWAKQDRKYMVYRQTTPAYSVTPKQSHWLEEATFLCLMGLCLVVLLSF